MPTPAFIPEFTGVTADIFRNEILPAGMPVVFRGLVRDWPVTQAALQSSDHLFEYLRRFDRGASVSTMFAPPSAKGRFFYNDDVSGFNFRSGTSKIVAALDYLASHRDDPEASALAVQSVPVRGHLPGFQEDNRMPLLDPSVEARIWIGNRVIVAAHHDPSDNIACCIAGRRRFTLFPPDQLPNLYVGPFELTPAGAIISMVDFDNPDLARYPRFAQAMEAAVVADLEPGDALYIPYQWWHHVRSIEAINMLVNYWWEEGVRSAPRDAFLHAILALRDLPPTHRAAWRTLFDHYVFLDNGPAAEHLAPERRGVLGDVTTDEARSIRTALSRALSRST
ncbi:MAG: cupin-like domain-containing protein [Novosphingobium sp.]|nr:MAG: cupin-like domain-containing protein [Novosphingobium sp.]